MWWIINLFVGSKIGRTVALVSGAGLILFLAIQYIEKQERDRVLDQVRIEALEGYNATRERINEVTDNLFNSVDDAADWLRGRSSEGQ